MLLPALAVNTALILSSLRTNLTTAGLDAYIVPYGGAHYDERVADCDARIKFISGFGGSAASVIISADKALLWTDGRYFLEAEQTLYPSWELMKEGEPGVPTQAQWLSTNANRTRKVGVAGENYPKSAFDTMKSTLASNNVALELTANFVDSIWDGFPEDSRVECPKNKVSDLPLNYSGKPVSEKLTDVRALMAADGADLLLISELEEVAWMLNARGSDLPQASVFFGFILLSPTTLRVFIDNVKINDTIEQKLRTEYNATLYEYAELEDVLKEEAPKANRVWLSKYVNAKLADAVPMNKQFIKLSPVMLMKSKKNSIEVQGMRNAHLRDSAAIIAFQAWLETQLNAGVTNITEMSASEKLYSIREAAGGIFFKGQSFTTIAGSGANGAVIHYRPAASTNANVNKTAMFLVDSGGLYLDGTCDITRTMHFGTPTTEQKEMYTRVLKGHVALARATFPVKTVGARLDAFARQALWDAGLDYKHGTGHGIGHFLNVHEGPQRVGSGYSPDDSGLEENMFISNEPGFYKDGEYGIRIENIVRIAKNEKITWADFLKIETVSFVPLHKNLINVTLLTDEEIEWVNQYHAECNEKVGKYIQEHEAFFDTEEVLGHLERETSPLVDDSADSGSSKMAFTFNTILTLIVTLTLSSVSLQLF